MQRMRDILKSSLGDALGSLTPPDRVAAAWPVAAGHAIAERTTVLRFDGGTVTIQAPDAAWQNQLGASRERLRSELARVSGLPVADILFVLAGPSRAGRKYVP